MTNSVYHPFLNSNGTYKASDGKFWYETTVPLNTVADCFKPANIGTVNGRPDGKSDKYIYTDNFIECREYAKILNRDEVNLIVTDKEENGVEEEVFTKEIKRSSDATLKAFNYWTNTYPWFSGVGEITYSIGDIALIMLDNSYQATVTITGKSYEGTKPYYFCDILNGSFTNNNTATSITVSIVKTKPILSSNTKLSIDLIGNPINYPQILKDRLASGVGVVGVNPLLVSDTGISLIPDGASKEFKMVDKVSNRLTHLYTNGIDNETFISGVGYDSIATSSNSFTETLGPSQLFIHNYTSKNQPYIQSNPLQVIDVEPKVVASNSHSIYKGALIGNQVSGKIQVGNGSNGYESKVLENVVLGTYDYEANIVDTFNVIENQTVFLVTDPGFTNATVGHYYLRINGNFNAVINYGEGFNNPVYWQDLGTFGASTPTHSTLSLDNSNSPASKWFKALSQGNNGVVGSVYGKEMIYDVTFGDNEEFDQLTNGTDIDLNGNTIRTFVGHLPINGKVK